MTFNALDDLEAELTCSICTEVLYQPLTLLDCLHTFCGACVKRWFLTTSTPSHQRRQAGHTCPACRATVRGTKSNATVTTLLDMFLRARPESDRSDREKEQLRKVYRPGDNVLPSSTFASDRGRDRRRAPTGERIVPGDEYNDDDGRDRVGRLSVQTADLSIARSRSEVPGQARREGLFPTDHHEQSQRIRRASNTAPRSSQLPDLDPTGRQVEHQSSLRSLLSVSEFDSQEMEAGIMQQIAEEGLLEGIDISNLNEDQEEEITEMIAQAYRRRQREERNRRRLNPDVRVGSPSPVSETVRPLSRDREEPNSPPARLPTVQVGSPSRPEPRRSTVTATPTTSPTLDTSTNTTSSLLSVPTDGSFPSTLLQSGRSSSEGRQRANTDTQSRRERLATLSVNNLGQAAAAPSLSELRNMESSRPPAQSVSTRLGDSTIVQDDIHLDASKTFTQRSISGNADFFHRSPGNVPRDYGIPTLTREYTFPALVPQPLHSARSSLIEAESTPHSHQSQNQNFRSHPFVEPSISCRRCSKPHIEYSVHYHCFKCDGGNYNICSQCYRSERGCLHWAGVERVALKVYTKNAPPNGYPRGHPGPFHTLEARKYTRPTQELVLSPVSTPSVREFRTDQDPANRLQAGVFCDTCHSFSNACYWKCDVCNDGSWGYCDGCVSQAKHCSHPLSPISVIPNRGTNPPSSPNIPSSGISLPLFSRPAVSSRPNVTIGALHYQFLSFSHPCGICKHLITHNQRRFHCPDCDDGQYQVCRPCYSGLVASGQLPGVLGESGWRMCPNERKRHRMDVVSFLYGIDRVVVEQVVGGWSLDIDGIALLRDPNQTENRNPHTSESSERRWWWRESDGTISAWLSPSLHHQLNHQPESRTQGSNNDHERIPPPAPPSTDPKLDFRAKALWGWFPDDAPQRADELMFPRGADITEMKDINGDWGWGCYSRTTGLFPVNYCRATRNAGI